ncbi:type II toxin-antitoxin system VapB family antitoxin [Micromonospora sp. NPDC050686]|uniref:type II toxin-antitoxin system VapB family antitoxin n=1 Tax=Micromonospora sp. NPDC050686 TaxID=3154631 RepID=UPI0034100D31
MATGTIRGTTWETSAASRATIDIDAKLLAQSAKIFGTTTKTAIVNAVLKAVVDWDKRREFADWLKSGGLPDLTGPAETTEPRADHQDARPRSGRYRESPLGHRRRHGLRVSGDQITPVEPGDSDLITAVTGQPPVWAVPTGTAASVQDQSAS